MEKSEDAIQQEMFMSHWNTMPEERGLLFHVPNENQHKRMNIGVVPGVSDLIYLKKRTAYLIEVKTEKGTQLPSQKKWQKIVEEEGFDYYIVRDLEGFWGAINEINKI